MVGLVSLQQGPLGVAATSRARAAKPKAPAIREPGQSPQSQLQSKAQSFHKDAADPKQKGQGNQDPVARTSSATLFEASQISARLIPVETTAAALQAHARQAWSPPQSSLALRDRKI